MQLARAVLIVVACFGSVAGLHLPASPTIRRRQATATLAGILGAPLAAFAAEDGFVSLSDEEMAARVAKKQALLRAKSGGAAQVSSLDVRSDVNPGAPDVHSSATQRMHQHLVAHVHALNPEMNTLTKLVGSSGRGGSEPSIQIDHREREGRTCKAGRDEESQQGTEEGRSLRDVGPRLLSWQTELRGSSTPRPCVPSRAGPRTASAQAPHSHLHRHRLLGHSVLRPCGICQVSVAPGPLTHYCHEGYSMKLDGLSRQVQASPEPTRVIRTGREYGKSRSRCHPDRHKELAATLSRMAAKAARDTATRTAAAVATAAAVTNYDKWDALECSDDEDGERTHGVTFTNPKDREKFNAVMFNLSAWLTVAQPSMDHAELASLVKFVATQHGGDGANNAHLHQQIVAAMAMQDAACWERARTALLRLCWQTKQRVDEAKRNDEPADRVTASAVLLEAMGALNTLVACMSSEGEVGARSFFERLRDDPAGDLATRYAKYAFAQDEISRHNSALLAEDGLGELEALAAKGARSRDEDCKMKDDVRPVQTTASEADATRPNAIADAWGKYGRLTVALATGLAAAFLSAWA